jgi:hypothetical protein
METNGTPMGKYYEARLKIQAKSAPKEMMVANQEDDSDDGIPLKKGGNKKKMEVDGDDDVVEDFELSDEE